jgi:hypothetical protein
VAKSRKQRRTAKQMHADLVVLGYDGSYNRVAGAVSLTRTALSTMQVGLL